MSDQGEIASTRRSLGIRRAWANPTIRARMIAARRARDISEHSLANLRLGNTPEAQARSVAGHRRSHAAACAHQARMVEEMAAQAGVTRTCRDVALFREWVASGLRHSTLARWLGVRQITIARWIEGRARPRPFARLQQETSQ